MKHHILRALMCAALTGALLCGGATAEETETTILFSSEAVEITGDGAIVDDGEVRIDRGGTYHIGGTSDSARVVVSADSADVTIVLDGCDLTCEEDEVIYIKAASTALVLISEGTENTLISGISPDASDGDEDASGAALRAKCPLTIAGSGRLSVFGYINNGIASNDDLTIESGDIYVAAVNDGVKSKADLTVSGGKLCIDADMDGIQADGVLTVEGGDLDITTGTGADGAVMKVSDSSMMGGGPGGMMRMGGGRRNSQTVSNTASAEANGASDESAQSADEPEADNRSSPEMDDFGDDYDADAGEGSHKGLKSGADITVRGGSIALDCEDDAIHGDGDVTVADGEISIRSGDDGIHSDAALVIAGGRTDILYCYEGLEAKSVLISDGYLNIIATDDGMNVNGGSFGGPGFGSGEASGDDGEQPVLRITGGLVLVDSGGDGLDSNGSIYIEGGEVYVSGPSSNWDAAIDYGEGSSEFVVTGGIVMAAGYSGMAEAPDSGEDSQGSIFYVQDSYCEDGAAAVLADADGNTIAEHSFAHSFNCIVISSPDIAAGNTYTLTIGDTAVTIEMTENSYSNRSFGGMGGPSREASGEAEKE